MLSRTSTLFPGTLFTSLPDVRAEHLSDAKRVCIPIFSFHSPLCSHPMSIIGYRSRPKVRLSTASEPLSAPLRAFTGRPASAAEAAVHSCARDLRARIQLYVSTSQTAAPPAYSCSTHIGTRPFGRRRNRSAQGRERDRMNCCWMIRCLKECWRGSVEMIRMSVEQTR